MIWRVKWKSFDFFLEHIVIDGCFRKNDNLNFILACKLGFKSRNGQPCMPCPENIYGHGCSSLCECSALHRWVLYDLFKWYSCNIQLYILLLCNLQPYAAGCIIILNIQKFLNIHESIWLIFCFNFKHFNTMYIT